MNYCQLTLVLTILMVMMGNIQSLSGLFAAKNTNDDGIPQELDQHT